MSDDDEIKKELSAGDGSMIENLDDLPHKKLSGKRILLFIVLPLLLVGGGGGGLYMSGALNNLINHSDEKADTGLDEPKLVEDEPDGPTFFYEVQDIIVNLTSEGKKQRFLKLSVTLELVGATAVADMDKVMPRVTDQFQTFLRELRVEDMQGSAGVYRIRQELLERVRTAAYPTYVRDVLFRDILIQ